MEHRIQGRAKVECCEKKKHEIVVVDGRVALVNHRFPKADAAMRESGLDLECYAIRERWVSAVKQLILGRSIGWELRSLPEELHQSVHEAAAAWLRKPKPVEPGKPKSIADLPYVEPFNSLLARHAWATGQEVGTAIAQCVKTIPEPTGRGWVNFYESNITARSAYKVEFAAKAEDVGMRLLSTILDRGKGGVCWTLVVRVSKGWWARIFKKGLAIVDNHFVMDVDAKGRLLVIGPDGDKHMPAPAMCWAREEGGKLTYLTKPGKPRKKESSRAEEARA